MFTPKIRAFLCMVMCAILPNLTFSQSNNAATFTFTLKNTARTSAGVYKKDSTLVKTLWANKTYATGTYTEYWDGTDDYGNRIVSPDAMYDIKVLSSNVTYTWEGVVGNTSTSQTGKGVHRGLYTSMTGMAITGTTAYFCQGYSEGVSSQAKFDLYYPQTRIEMSGFKSPNSTFNCDFVSTDGVNVYWAGYNAYATSNSFVHATRVTDDAQVSFSSGLSYTMTQLPFAKTYTSVIDKLSSANSAPTGLAVQKSGSYLFVAHGRLNQLHVLDKTTGNTVQNLTITNPRYTCSEGNNLWMVSGANSISKYIVNQDGTLGSVLLTINAITTPGAMNCDGNGSIAIVDQDNQVLRFFNTTTGAEGVQVGNNGGYALSPAVSNSKFMFNDYRGNLFSFVAFAPDGSFWLGDPGNYRELHFSGSKVFVETIMSLGNVYSSCVDPNNISRAFANYLEFDIDYTQPLSGNTGWKLVNNWGYNSTSNTSTKKILNVTTLSNGKTYGMDYGGLGLAELTSGGLRKTGVGIGSAVINSDGSLTKFSGSYNIGNSVVYTKYTLSGFDGLNNPIWSSNGTLLAQTPPNTVKDPNNFPGNVSPTSYNFVTASGKVIFYNPSKFYGGTTTLYDGYHLGAIRAGSNNWLWKTQKSDHLNYQGAFPEADYFEIGNNVNQYAGSNVNVVDNNIITGYHGEFWKNAQTNYYNHYFEDGLAVGQFGTDGHISPFGVAAFGYAGNALSPVAVKDNNGNIYLYHGDESQHAALHRWKISNLSSISEQYISVPYPANYNKVAFGYLDLHAGLPFDATLPNAAGWSKSGTVTSNTSQKKYINDGSPDVFSIFNQSSGSATVKRDLGINNVSNSWKISGQITFEGSDVNAGSQTMAYIDVLDASGKILTRFYYSNDHNTGITTIYGNDQVVVQSSTGVNNTLLSLQPFEVSVNNGQATFIYANYSAVSANIFDPSANWKTPQALRAYFVSGFPSYGKNIGFVDMKFYKDYSNSINLSPIANAGIDTLIALPVNTITLKGIATDADGTITNYAWNKISGPSSGSINNANSSTTVVTSLVQGIYKFELRVTDNLGAVGLDTIQVTVNPPINLPPVANAGPDLKITLPVSLVSLAGSGGDADGTVVSYLWTKISGPSAYTIVNASSPVTDIFGLGKGIYNFQLEVTDNNGATARDTIQITVNAAINIPPVANAGIDITVVAPTNTTTLNGSATDIDGTVVSYLWTKISGPGSFTITNNTSPATNLSGLALGIYQFELAATDNNGAVGKDTVQVSVSLPANIPPIADAGQDQVISLPKNTLRLVGGGADPDGIIVSYYWTKISGPSSGAITSATYPVTSVSTLTQGFYSFELMVTDNKGAIGRDTMEVAVTPASLPLKLLSFTGTLSNRQVLLNWETTNEKNVLGFEIERMVGGTWDKIGFVPSATVAVLSNHYSLTDTYPENGINYYRLKIVDVDGKFVYSDIISIELKPEKDIIYECFPNPFSSVTTINFEIAEKNLVQINVYNALGTKIATLMKEKKEAGVYSVEWNAGNMAPGSYYYQIIIGDNAVTKKMLKLY